MRKNLQSKIVVPEYDTDSTYRSLRGTPLGFGSVEKIRDHAKMILAMIQGPHGVTIDSPATASFSIMHLWRAARMLDNEPPPPPEPEVGSLRQAVNALDLLLRWCEENGAKPSDNNLITSPVKSGDRKVTVESRMYDLVQKNHSTHTWTIRQFADKLRCSEGAIHKTKAWKSLKTSREMARQTRSEEAYHKNRDRSPSVHK